MHPIPIYTCMYQRGYNGFCRTQKDFRENPPGMFGALYKLDLQIKYVSFKEYLNVYVSYK